MGCPPPVWGTGPIHSGMPKKQYTHKMKLSNSVPVQLNTHSTFSVITCKEGPTQVLIAPLLSFIASCSPHKFVYYFYLLTLTGLKSLQDYQTTVPA